MKLQKHFKFVLLLSFIFHLNILHVVKQLDYVKTSKLVFFPHYLYNSLVCLNNIWL